MGWFVVFLALASFLSSCNFQMHDVKELDEDLFGTWAFYNADNSIQVSWSFEDDGSCIHFSEGLQNTWSWEIEMGKLKCSSETAEALIMDYSIEGNYLYFYEEESGEWGLPFIKIE